AQRQQLIKALENEMLEHAKNLEFEQAAAIRDEIEKIRGIGETGEPRAGGTGKPGKTGKRKKASGE
ncbi:MAG: UvrB/UvrC motif-containing protein, partial [Treponema sp.]|nr:UvrB/UvrC motif-containing protein [Treponema sp.]